MTLTWKRTTDRALPLSAFVPDGKYTIRQRKDANNLYMFVARWSLDVGKELGAFSTIDGAKAACEAHSASIEGRNAQQMGRK